MNNQNMAYLCNRVLFSHKKEWSIDTCWHWDEFWIHYATWKKQTQKLMLLWFYSHEISRIGKSIEEMRGCQGLKGGSNVEWLSTHSGFFLWWRKYPAIRQWWWLYNLVTTLKTLKWYSLKRWISWHANYISILKIICYLKCSSIQK